MAIHTVAEDARETKRWVEFILAPLLVLSVITLTKCTASAQDELIVLQRDVAQINEVNGDTKESIKQIEKDNNDTKLNVAKIEANQKHFKEQINKLQSTQEETNRLLRTLSPR